MPLDTPIPDSVRIKTLDAFLRRFSSFSMAWDHSRTASEAVYVVYDNLSPTRARIGQLVFNPKTQEIEHFLPSPSMSWELGTTMSQLIMFKTRF